MLMQGPFSVKSMTDAFLGRWNRGEQHLLSVKKLVEMMALGT